MKLATFLSAGALLAAVIGGCAAQTKAKDDKLCTPGAYVFCRCQDRAEGAKLCNETGNGFGKCEPCETDTNPEIDPGSTSSSGSSGDPFPEEDSGPSSGDGGPSGGDCGDGVVQVGEDCDDKNTNDTDGCNTSCKLAGTNPSSTNNCPGMEVHVWGGAHKPTITGSTVGAPKRGVTPNCTNQPANSTSGAAGGDRVFKVIAHKTGTLSVKVSDNNYDAFLFVVADGKCTTSTTLEYLACRNGVNGAGAETITVPVDAGKTYHVFVDGAGIGSDNEGNFRVTFEIP